MTAFLLYTASGPDEPITQSTNRGNKLKANAEYVREGALGYINSEELYKQVDWFPPSQRNSRRAESGSLGKEESRQSLTVGIP